jgi:hypothetical protein
MRRPPERARQPRLDMAGIPRTASILCCDSPNQFNRAPSPGMAGICAKRSTACRRRADIADRGRLRRSWAESAPKGTASGRTAVWAKAGIPVRARNRLCPHSAGLSEPGFPIWTAVKPHSILSCSRVNGNSALSIEPRASSLRHPRLAQAFQKALAPGQKGWVVAGGRQSGAKA